jgi:sugar phosphate isomerase/epimerase
LTPQKIERRNFLKSLSVPVITAGLPAISLRSPDNNETITNGKPHLKLSLNAYAFNKELLSGSMTIEDMLEFCAAQGLMGVDITGYYFKGYPHVPSDEVIYSVKRKAFDLGLEICGTGVRNDFTHPDEASRSQNVQLVKDWIGVCEKLGGQTIRIFSGTQAPAGYTRDQIFKWVVEDIRECVQYGKAHGVVVALQNHDDFIKTADDTIQIMEAIQSRWYGLMLDIGSFRTADPYYEISQTVKYAVTWQIKEKVFDHGKEVDVDPERLIRLIKNSGFRGYLPLETLGEGDPKKKIAALFKKFTSALGRK